MLNNNEYILQELSKSTGSLKNGKKTSSKFPIIKEILLKIISTVPSETQLPSIRTIAGELGTSILPVHKAMSELKNEGFINTKSTSGYFTLARHRKTTDSTALSSFELHRSNLNFATDSSEPFQKKFWNDLIHSGFGDKQHLLSDINIIFSSFKSSKEIIKSNIDILENNPFSFNNLNLSEILLKIEDFIPYDKNITCYNSSLLPIYFHTSYLFYNADFLDKFNLPRPSFSSFSEQSEYLKLMDKSIKKLNPELSIGTSVQPAMYLGSFFKMLIDSLSLTESTLKQKQNESLKAVFSDIIDLSSFFTYWSNAKDEYINVLFEKELCPFFLAGSMHYWRMLTEKPHFNWCAYPLLTVDNSLLKLPVYASVVKGTRDPVGAVQFILSLLDTGIQKAFSTIGLISVNNNLFTLKELPEKEMEYFKNLFKNSETFFLKNYSSYYIFNNILGQELLKSALGIQSSNDALRNTIQCAKAYLAGNF